MKAIIEDFDAIAAAMKPREVSPADGEILAAMMTDWDEPVTVVVAAHKPQNKLAEDGQSDRCRRV